MSKRGTRKETTEGLPDVPGDQVRGLIERSVLNVIDDVREQFRQRHLELLEKVFSAFTLNCDEVHLDILKRLRRSLESRLQEPL